MLCGLAKSKRSNANPDLERGPHHTNSDTSKVSKGSAGSSTLFGSNQQVKSTWDRLGDWLCEDTYYPNPHIILLTQSFATSIVDAATLLRFGTFVASQTGNLLILGIRFVDVPSTGKISHCLVSLAGFIFGAFLTNLACRRYTPPFPSSSASPTRRYYLLLTMGAQAALLIIPAALFMGGVVQMPPAPRISTFGNINRSYLVCLGMMALSFGAQSAMAKLICPKGRLSPIPTIVISIAMADLVADPRLFAFSFPRTSRRYEANWARNDRFFFICVFFAGGFAGAGMVKRVSVEGAIMLAAGIKLLPLVLVMLAGTDPGSVQKEEDSHTVKEVVEVVQETNVERTDIRRSER